jgi:putative FmdB family regulatory protein
MARNTVNDDMPIYEYKCEFCSAVLEKLQKVSEEPLRDCPECGKSTLVKLVSAPSFRLKGAGGYATDFKPGKKKNGAGADSDGAATSGAGGEAKSGGATGSGEAKSSEMKRGETKSGETKSGDTKSGEIKNSGATNSDSKNSTTTTPARTGTD